MLAAPLGDGVFMRVYEPADAPAAFAAVDRDRAHLAPWLPWVHKTLTVEDSAAFIKISIERLAAGDGLAAALWTRDTVPDAPHPWRCVGGVGLHHAATKFAEMGWWLAESMQGRGLMTRAAAMVMDHAFEVCGVHRVQVRAALDNVRSRRVAERLGMHYEGVERCGADLDGRAIDMAMYSTVAADRPPR